MTEHGEGIFRGAGGLKFYYQRWRPQADPPRAVLAFVRGAGDSSGLYLTLASHLVPQGYAVYGFTHRELGRSPQQQGYIQEWGESLEDVRAFLEMVGEEEAGQPFFLMGNGFAGAMVQAYALHHREGLTGVIVFDPVQGQHEGRPLLLRVVHLLSHVWPGFTSSAPPSSSTISLDPAVQASQDELQAQRKGTARARMEGGTAVTWGQARIGDGSIPLLIFQREGEELLVSRGRSTFSPAEYEQLLGELEGWMEELL